jgi:dihydroneopterin aldolase/2-amino-4-hydroxy-6-hydroxymethyldihydropteridine diphosphokinase
MPDKIPDKILDKISLSKMCIFAYHGVYPEEQTLGQKFIVSIDLFADLSLICRTDNIADGFCYGDTTHKIIHFCSNNRFNTLETLSHALGKYLFFTNKIIQNLVIKIEKPNAPINCNIDSVSIEIHRSRNDYEADYHSDYCIADNKNLLTEYQKV